MILKGFNMNKIILNNREFTILKDDKRSAHYCVLYKHFKKYDLDCCYNNCSRAKIKAYYNIVKDNFTREVTSHLYILSYNKSQFITGHLELDDDGTKWLIVNTKDNVYAMVYPFKD